MKNIYEKKIIFSFNMKINNPNQFNMTQVKESYGSKATVKLWLLS